MTVVEMRCPVESQRMFGRMMMEGTPRIVPGNLMEFSCDRCRKKDPQNRRVLHRFNVAGELIETVVV